MMKDLIIPDYQLITNKICAKQDFVWVLKEEQGNYAVGHTVLWSGKNPSMEPEMVLIIHKVITAKDPYYLTNSIRGFNNKEKGVYEVMTATHFCMLENARDAARMTGQKHVWDIRKKKPIEI